MDEENYKYDFTKQELKMAEFMRALAHPARIAIMIKLAQMNECLEEGVVPNIPITNSSNQRHLLALEYAGLIKGITSINRAYYCIDWETFGEFVRDFKQFFHDFEMKDAQLNCQVKKGRRKPFYTVALPFFPLLSLIAPTVI